MEARTWIKNCGLVMSSLTPFVRLTRVATPAPIHLHLGIIGIVDIDMLVHKCTDDANNAACQNDSPTALSFYAKVALKGSLTIYIPSIAKG